MTALDWIGLTLMVVGLAVIAAAALHQLHARNHQKWRAKAYASALRGGFLSLNEVRLLQSRPPEVRKDTVKLRPRPLGSLTSVREGRVGS